MNHEVITLCGSTRYQDDFERAMRELTLAGAVVLSCGVFGKGRDSDVFCGIDDAEAVGIKRILDSVHVDKIDLAGSIFVINPDDYIGESTWREIVYAAMTGKAIRSIMDISIGKIQQRIDEEVRLAERFASWQLDVVSHNPYNLSGAAVSFSHKGIEVFDPWIREDQQGEPWIWEMHDDPSFKINPPKHYGKKKFARYVFDAMQAMSEYRELQGYDLPLPDYKRDGGLPR